MPNSKNSRLGRERRNKSKQIRIPKTPDFSGVALTTFKSLSFLSPNARISAMSPHSPSMKNGLETHEKDIVVCFYDVFFVGMCTLVCSRHMGKPNLNNACLFSHRFSQSK